MILLLLSFAGVFTVVFSLYNLSVEPVFYAVLLCLVIGVIALIFAFYQYRRKRRLLLGLQKNVTVSIGELHGMNGLYDREYEALIEILSAETIRLTEEYALRRNETAEYYTLWAHQIKTPIAAMRLLLQSDRSAQVNELESELFKIEQYVGMVLGFLRTDHLSSDLLLRQVALDELIRQAVRKYAREFIRRRIGLDFRETGIVVLTDEKWLVYVMEQLLSNALKYTKQGQISIYPDPAAPNTLVIEDTGAGVRAEDLPRVFERGFTGFNGRVDQRSTGIGLYLCKRIMDRLNHTITIESEAGRGTKVRLGLERAELNVE
jgi:signal transduction histidine kinase